MLKTWSVTDKGAVRQQNQDSCRVEQLSEKLVLCVVCDGMGGARAGNVASRLAADTMTDFLRERYKEHPEASPAEGLQEAAELANQAVHYRAGIDPECRGMGTTMVAVLAEEHVADILNIGDSRCYHVTGDGIVKITRDHSVVEDLVVRGELTPEAARTHPQKNLITRALGAEERIRADLYRLELKEGDFLLLCSDGLSNVLTDQEILYEILHGGPIEECCGRLLNITLSRGAPDNVTAILLQV